MCAKVSSVDAGSYLPTPATQPSPVHILSLFIWSNAYSCVREPSANVPWTEAALDCLPSETSGEDAGALGVLCARRDSSHYVPCSVGRIEGAFVLGFFLPDPSRP